MKKNVKIIVDVLMFIIFLIMMGYHITGNLIHEILGIKLFILFIIHHILNIRWYKTLFKGKFNGMRTLLVITDILLLLSMLGMMISAILISNKVFAFLNVPLTSIGTRLHMLSTSWGFIIMTFHLAIHLHPKLNKADTKMKETNFEYTYYIIILILIFGIYSFIDSKLYSDMLLLTEYKYFNFEQSLFLFYIKYIGIILANSLIIHQLLNITKKINKNNNERK